MYPRTFSTSQLKTEINLSLKRLAPLFGINPQELEKFKKPKIRRTLRKEEYPEADRLCPFYSFLDNYFYFPKNQEKEGDFYNAFSRKVINHEAGHYLHNNVNPEIVEGFKQFLITGDNPPGHITLIEIVAEYGNIILYYPDDYPNDRSICSDYSKAIKIFSQEGPEFLKVLARMPLKNAIARNYLTQHKQPP